MASQDTHNFIATSAFPEDTDRGCSYEDEAKKYEDADDEKAYRQKSDGDQINTIQNTIENSGGVGEKGNKIVHGTTFITSNIDKQGNIDISVKYDKKSWECCTCFEPILGPISSCNNLHSMCSDCIKKMVESRDYRCPVCRSYERNRLYLLEMVLASIVETCPFEKQGCTYRSYPENMKDHTDICKYAEIKCPWCKKKTTPFDLHTHTEFECKYQFSGVSCSNNIEFIKSEDIDNVYIISAMEESRELFVEKTDDMCNILCIQTNDSDDLLSVISMSYTVGVKSLDGMTLVEERKIMLPIHKPEHLIRGNILFHSIPLEEMKGYSKMTVTGFKEKYMKGGRWMCQDIEGNWYRATIRERRYNPDRVLVKYDEYPSDTYDEWIEITNGESSPRIKPLEANNGRTTREERLYIENMSEEEQLRLVMARSMDET